MALTSAASYLFTLRLKTEVVSVIGITAAAAAAGKSARDQLLTNQGVNEAMSNIAKQGLEAHINYVSGLSVPKGWVIIDQTNNGLDNYSDHSVKEFFTINGFQVLNLFRTDSAITLDLFQAIDLQLQVVNNDGFPSKQEIVKEVFENLARLFKSNYPDLSIAIVQNPSEMLQIAFKITISVKKPAKLAKSSSRFDKFFE
jgi:hypothetical protein